MKTIPLLCFLFLLFLLPTALYAQGPTPVGTNSGRVQLQLLDAFRQPVGGARATFVSEAQEPLAQCTTDGAGRCTLLLESAPADASGFIRGAVVVEGRGRKPLIWPGGEIEIELVLNPAGQLDIPRDLYPTRTPNATEIAAGTPAPAPVTDEPTATTAPALATASPTGATASPAATTSPPPSLTATPLAPGATATIAVASSPSTNSPLGVQLGAAIDERRVEIALFSGLLILVTLYVWLGRRPEPAEGEEPS